MKTRLLLSVASLVVLIGCATDTAPSHKRGGRLSPDPTVDDVTYLLNEHAAVEARLDNPELPVADRVEAFNRLVILDHLLAQSGVPLPEKNYIYYQKGLREAEHPPAE